MNSGKSTSQGVRRRLALQAGLALALLAQARERGPAAWVDLSGLAKGIYLASENGKSVNYVGWAGSTGVMFLAEAALKWTSFDRYFAAIMSSTYPNRIYQHAAVTDRLDSSLTISTLPTIWDRLAQSQ